MVEISPFTRRDDACNSRCYVFSDATNTAFVDDKGGCDKRITTIDNIELVNDTLHN